MRLTLRTLLAYLDDVLDPVDKEELAQKIASSEFAEDLVHRTRDTVRRLRLSAPQVIGSGMALDPNTVAEYLDNVMPPEQVGDFERICLESDVHLAEATACHHVLTMILGEPADVDPIARQRMYTIAGELGGRQQLRIEPAHTAPAAVAANAPLPPVQVAAPAPTKAERRHTTEVPDYLRAGSWWRSTRALVGLAAVVLVGTAMMFASGLRGWFGSMPASESQLTQQAVQTIEPRGVDTFVPDAASATANSPPDATTPPSETAPIPSTASTTGLAAPPPPMTPGLPPLTAVEPASPSSASQAHVEPSAPTTVPVEPPSPTDTTTPAPSATAGSESPMPPVPAAPPAAPGATAATAAAAASLPIPPQPSTLAAGEVPSVPTATAPDVPPPSSLVAAADRSATEPPLAPPAEPAAPEAPGTPTDVSAAAPPDSGTYMGGKTVLLRHDDSAGTWFRVEPRAAVIPGVRLLSLPEFRPKIALTSGLHLELAGGTQIVMGGGPNAPAGAPPAAKVVPAIELVYGRLIIINPTNSDQHIRLALGAANGTAKLAHNATLAVEVEREFVPGQDPRTTPGPLSSRLFAPDGGITWQDAAGEKSFDQAARWLLAEGGATDVATDAAPPEWIDEEPVVQLSERRYGAPDIESTLVSNTPAETQLLELFQGSSRKEVKSLVARSSVHVGLYQPFIDALRDSDQRANWESHIQALRAAMVLSPQSAENVYQALVDQRGKPAAADLYEMLCSYSAEQLGQSPEQIKTGPLLKLIDWLEDDSLDYRVLAVQDLRELTGKKLMPNPAANLTERKQNIRVWRSRLESGQLIKPAPAPNATTEKP